MALELVVPWNVAWHAYLPEPQFLHMYDALREESLQVLDGCREPR